jgi:hypothetical protein
VFRTKRGRLTLRERLESAQRGNNFYAVMTGKPKVESQLLAALPPKRDRVKRPVDGKPVNPSEYQEQGAVIDWWWQAHKSFQLPVFALFSVPNGAYLATAHYGAAMLKKAGMRSGTPDLVLAVPRGSHHGLFAEMKSINGRESDEQQAFGAYLASAGYKFAFCYGADAAIAVIKQYLTS